MGYSTDFDGELQIEPALSEEDVSRINAFTRERHDGAGFPGIWCDWEVSEDGTEIGWSGKEKSYCMPEWISYLIQNFMEGHTLNGTMQAAGEDADDRWYIKVLNNNVFTEDALIVPAGKMYPVGAEEPIALPDNSGLRVLNHLQLGEYIGDYLKDLGGDAPEEVVKVFSSLFDYPITINADGTFTIDEDI